MKNGSMKNELMNNGLMKNEEWGRVAVTSRVFYQGDVSPKEVLPARERVEFRFRVSPFFWKVTP